MFAADSDSNRFEAYHAVWRLSPGGQVLGAWGNQGNRAGHFYFPPAEYFAFALLTDQGFLANNLVESHRGNKLSAVS